MAAPARPAHRPWLMPARPLLAPPNNPQPGDTLKLGYTSADPVTKALLLRTGAVTHSMSFGAPPRRWRCAALLRPVLRCAAPPCPPCPALVLVCDACGLRRWQRRHGLRPGPPAVTRL